MDSKLDELLADVQEQLLAEMTRRDDATDTLWYLLVEDLPLDFSELGLEEASYKLEHIVRTEINNGLPTNEMDYAVHLAQEYLNDIDYKKLALRHGAQEDIT